MTAPSTPRRSGRAVRALAAGLALAAGSGVALSGLAAGAATPPRVKVTTVVTTTVPIYEFTTWFGVSAVEVSCEIDHHLKVSDSVVANVAYCESASKRLTHNVTVSDAGVVKTCVGPTCGSNAGLGTPSFYPGTEVRSGPFACVVSAHAVSCREHGARGFVITASSITKL